MALYQATNITPDLISGRENGIVFRNDASWANQNIRWTVNGNSRLTAYRIQFFRNDANSTPGTDTGKVDAAGLFSLNQLPVQGQGSGAGGQTQQASGLGGNQSLELVSGQLGGFSCIFNLKNTNMQHFCVLLKNKSFCFRWENPYFPSIFYYNNRKGVCLPQNNQFFHKNM